MKSGVKFAVALVLALAALACFAQPAGYPAKPIRIVVGYSAGGGNDLIVRVIAPRMSEGLGQPVVVDNRPGAQSIIAAEMVKEAGLPYIVVLTDPTTGGVTASFAMLGDLNIAEPGAQIGFAGPRVIEQTIRQKLPEGFQRSEFLLKHGMLDAVVPRGDLRSYITSALEFFAGPVVRAAA